MLSSVRSGTGLLPLSLCASALGLFVAGCDRQAPEQPQAAPAAAPAAKAGAVDRTHKGDAAPAAAFEGPDGRPKTLAAFRGKPFLVNLWATWCAPCVAELPTLDRLAGSGVRVVAVSQDLDAAKPAPFLRAKGLAHLTPFRDPQLALSAAYAANLPTSIFYDAAGRELWRVSGGRDWTDAASRALLTER